MIEFPTDEHRHVDRASDVVRRDSVWIETLKFCLVFAVVQFLLVVCIGIPIVVARNYGAGFALLASVFSLFVWVYLGPPPMPGFGNGIVCLCGLGAIVGVMIANFVLVVMAYL